MMAIYKEIKMMLEIIVMVNFSKAMHFSNSQQYYFGQLTSVLVLRVCFSASVSSDTIGDVEWHKERSFHAITNWRLN